MKFFKNKLAVTIVLLSVVFLILIGYTSRKDNKLVIVTEVSAPLDKIQGVFYNINSKINDFFSFVFNFSEIKEENKELINKNAELEEKAAKYDDLKNENDRLRDMLDFKSRNSYYKSISAHIMNRAGDGVINEYSIDRGYKDGVSVGKVVVSPQGLIGQITSAKRSTAIVETLSSENIAVAGTVLNSNETGIVKGYRDSENRALAKIYNLPVDSKIKSGDIIITDNKGDIYPKGIKIGYVISVEEDRINVAKNALIQPYVDYNKLQELMVIVPKDEDKGSYSGEIK